MMSSAKKMAALPANVQKVIRDAAVESTGKFMWEANLKEQGDAWKDLTTKATANDSPNVASFRAKMGPVVDSFVAKAGPKAKAYIEAVQAAGKA